MQKLSITKKWLIGIGLVALLGSLVLAALIAFGKQSKILANECYEVDENDGLLIRYVDGEEEYFEARDEASESDTKHEVRQAVCGKWMLLTHFIYEDASSLLIDLKTKQKFDMLILPTIFKPLIEDRIYLAVGCDTEFEAACQSHLISLADDGWTQLLTFTENDSEALFLNDPEIIGEHTWRLGIYVLDPRGGSMNDMKEGPEGIASHLVITCDRALSQCSITQDSRNQ